MIEKKIILGTANFGARYGINNNAVDLKSAKKLIKLAEEKNINILDISEDYKEAKKILKRLDIKKFDIITKISTKDVENEETFNLFKKKISVTLKNLGKKIYSAILVRQPENFLKNKKYKKFVTLLKDHGLVEKIGYSIYSPKCLKEIYQNWKPDIIQIPYNILDNRFEKGGWLNILTRDKVIIHARSIFLQGLLFKNSENLPKKFKQYENIWIKYEKWLKVNKISSLEACINFILADKRIHNIVVGVDDIAQLKQVLQIRKLNIKYSLNIKEVSEKILDPRLWNN